MKTTAQKTTTKKPAKVETPQAVTPKAGKQKKEIIRTNNATYEVVGNGKVKKVNDLKNIAQVVDMKQLSLLNELRAIYGFLRDKDDTAVLKAKHIVCRDYKMGFTEMGFTIYDMKNYGKRTDFDIPMPTPREVWEYISKVQKEDAEYVKRMVDKMRNDKKAIREKVEAGKAHTEKVLSQRAAKKALSKKVVVDQEPEKDEVSVDQLEALRKKTITMLKRSTKIVNVIEKMKGIIPHRGFIVLYNKLLRKYKRKEIRAPRFLMDLLELVQTVDFTPKRERAPKFTGEVSYDIESLEKTSEGMYIVKSGKATYTLSETEILCRFMLSDERWMAPLMKLLRGEITHEEYLAEPYKKDIYVAYDQRLIKPNNPAVNETLKKLMRTDGTACPLDFYYNNYGTVPLKIGDKLLVQYLDLCLEKVVRVVSVKDGVEVRHEDGSIEHLLKHQTWELLK